MNCPSCQAANQAEAEVCFRCGRSLYALTEGSILNQRYQVLRPLGKGGMGMVYQAHDAHLDELVAVKVLRWDLAQAAALSKRFRSEIKLARKVRHRNVCGIHEYGQSGHLQYIVMEYVQGVDLRQVLQQRGALPPGEAFEIAVQLAEGLQAIHDEGIVHRDLKTPNIMRDQRGFVRLMDFGIAKQFEGEATGATMSGQIVGTPEYMSPEQARGERVDARTDIYALGVVVYELFAGEVPFRGDTPLATLMKHLNEPPPMSGGAAARLPPAVVPVLQRALAKDRQSRFGSAREMGDALRHARDASALAPDAQTAGTAPSEARERLVGAVVPAPAEAVPTTPLPTPVPSPTPVFMAVDSGISPAPTPSGEAVAAADRAPTVLVNRPSPSVPKTARLADRPVRHTPAARRPARPQRRWVLPSVAAAAALAGVVVAGRLLWRTSPSPAIPSADRVDAGPATPAGPGIGPAPASPTALPSDVPVVQQSAQPHPATPRPASVATPPGATPPRAPVANTPTRATSPAPAAAASPRPTPAAVPAAPASNSAIAPQPKGTLRLRVLPWAEVIVDGSLAGTTPLAPLELPAGWHVVRLNHPDYKVLQKRVEIRSGEVTRIEVDLAQEAFRK